MCVCVKVCVYKRLNFRTQTFEAKMFVYRVDIRDPKVSRMHSHTQIEIESNYTQLSSTAFAEVPVDADAQGKFHNWVLLSK